MRRRLIVLAFVASVVGAQDKKISELPDGSPGQATDAIPIARAGANYRLPFSTFQAYPATYGTELAPAIAAPNWTCGAGWDCSVAGTLNKNAAGLGTAAPNPPVTLVAGTTYKVTMTVGALTVASGATYTLGGSPGSALTAATTYTDYITAATTGNLIIAPIETTTRFTVTAVSIKALADSTGDLTIDGNLIVNSPVVFRGGVTGFPGFKFPYIPNQTLFNGTMVIGTGGTFLAREPEGAEPNPIPEFNGQHNTFVGIGAGDVNTVGTFNTFVGAKTGSENTNGDQNTFVGGWAGYHNTTGYHNTFLGTGAGQANTTGYGNVFVGTDAGLISTIGTDNTFIGQSTGTGNTSGTANTFVGGGAGAANGTGSFNVAIGYSALVGLVDSASNVAIGYAALATSTGATQSVAIGAQSMRAGAASGNGNTSVGYFSGYSLGTGVFNTFIGVQAGQYVTNGHFNVLIGPEAGVTSGATPSVDNKLTTGMSNTFIGRQSGLGSTTQRTNATAIGAQAYVDADNTVVLGDENVISVLASSDGGATLTAGAFKVGANTGVSGTVVVKGSDGNNCNLVFEGGILTSETCP